MILRNRISDFRFQISDLRPRLLKVGPQTLTKVRKTPVCYPKAAGFSTREMNENRTAIPTQTWLCLFVTGEKQTDVSADYADDADSVRKREAAVFEGSGSPVRLMKKEGKRTIHEPTQNKN